MKKILVPVDFSQNSSNALIYAQELAGSLDASVQVIHVMHPSLNSSVNDETYNFEIEIASREEQLKSFVQEGLDQRITEVMTKVKIDQEVSLGYAGEEIINYATQGEMDFIVMGTTGKGGVIDRLLGSISTIVAQRSTCPVLLVPQQVTFKKYEHILYASDFKSSSNKVLDKIVDLSDAFAAKIHMVHVQAEQEEHDFEMEELILDQMISEKGAHASIKFVTVWDANIWHGLNAYARDHEIDLMVFVKPHRNFWERLLHRSVTLKMIEDTPRPVLILPVED